MKLQADSKQTEREFQEGDMVYLKLQPHVQTSVASRGNHKFAFRFFGPYKILQKVGTVAYKLDLPAHTQIHPVVHVSQLKQCVPSNTEVIQDLSLLCADPAQECQPLHILDRALVAKGTASAFRVKVQWSALPVALITWEDEADLYRRFPSAVWGQPAA